jgi:SAM-dependent methyltransferase
MFYSLLDYLACAALPARGHASPAARRTTIHGNADAAGAPDTAKGVDGMVFDLGCGTGWTTEWLVRLGYQPIGVDLCRDYVLAGMARRGRYAPQFVIGVRVSA